MHPHATGARCRARAPRSSPAVAAALAFLERPTRRRRGLDADAGQLNHLFNSYMSYLGARDHTAMPARFARPRSREAAVVDARHGNWLMNTSSTSSQVLSLDRLLDLLTVVVRFVYV